MTVIHPGTRNSRQIFARHNAWVAAFHAARLQYENVQAQMIAISVDYVSGRVDQAQVRAAAEQFLASKYALREAADRVQLSMAALRKMYPARAYKNAA